jgi:glycosyltransferase involved in cell wall biosynthesis
LPSSRTRAHLIADYLRSQGYEAESHHIITRPWWNLSKGRFRDLANNFRLLKSVGKEDILYLHKMTDQVDFMFLVLFRKWLFGRSFIFDFDDAIFLPSLNRAAKARLMVQNAEAVVVGSHFLQEYALKHNPRSYVLSAPIDTECTYVPAQERINDIFVRIGWTGTPGHFENMKLLLEPLSRLIAEGKKIRFVQLGGGEKIYALLQSIPGLSIEFTPEVPWDVPSEVVHHIQQFDIGVMPLQPTDQNRGKDAWKAKEYMGCGVATVASDWGENPYVITDGKDGFLPSTADEWHEALRRLIEDPDLRSRIGTAGRARMDQEYSYKAFLPKFLSITGLTKSASP